MSTPIAQPAPSPVPSRRGWVVFKWAILVIAAALALGLFVQRGVMRGIEGSWDFTMVYAGAHQLVQGGDPYDFESTYDAFAAAGGTGRPRDPMWFQTLYPPFTYAVLSPLGLLNWQQAKLVWLVLNLISTAAVAVWLVRHSPANHPLTPGPRPPFRMTYGTYWALVLWLGSAVLHTTLAFGQLAVITLALMLPAIGFEKFTSDGRIEEPSPWLSPCNIIPGIMLALAGSIKPQLVALIALMLLVTPCVRIAVWGVGIGLIFLAGSFFWVSQVTPDWLPHWQEQLAEFAKTGMADPTAANRFTYQMINLEPWLHRLVPSGFGPRTLFAVIAIALPATLYGLSVTRLRRWQLAGRELNPQQFIVSIGIAAASTLLIAYHRTYDAVLLIIPALWAWRQVTWQRNDMLAWFTLIATAAFLLPGPALLASSSRNQAIESYFENQYWIWRSILLAHQNIAVLVVALLTHIRIYRPFERDQ